MYCGVFVAVSYIPKRAGGIFDAHALWHAATIPLVFLFYSFILDDARFEAGLATQKTL
jgi:predicted membrane channel-forming protein YqfA (hemolysin III family)